MHRLPVQTLLDSLGDLTTVLDEHGTVVGVNLAWRRFAERNDGPADAFLGDNYLQVCERAAAAGVAEAAQVLKGIRDLLAGRSSSFQFDYLARHLDRRRWYRLVGVPLETGGVLIRHKDITRERQALEELRTARIVMQGVARGMELPVLLLDREGRLLFSNRRADELILQLSRRPTAAEEYLGDIVPEPHRAALLQGLQEAFRGREVDLDQLMLDHWYSCSFRPLFSNGVVYEVCVTFLDETPRHLAIEGSRESKRRLAQLLDMVPLAVVSWRADTLTITGWNSTASRMFGFDAEEVVGTRKVDMLTPSIEGAHHLFGQTIAPSTADRVAPVWEATTKSGEPVVCTWTTHPLTVRDEAVIEMITFAQEVHGSDGSSEVQRAADTQLTRFMRSTPVPILILSLDRFLVRYANASFLELTEMRESDLLGRAVTELDLLPSNEGAWGWLKPDAKDAATTQERWLQTASRNWRAVVVSGEPIMFGGESSFLLTFVDISDRKRSEEDLLRAIQKVMEDAEWFGRSVLERLAKVRSVAPDTSGGADLTDRETQVLGRIARGRTNQEIAEDLAISYQTVRNYVTRIYHKIDVHSRAEAVVWAREHGLIGG